MKFKTQLTIHNSSFLAPTRTPNIKGWLTWACLLQRYSYSLQWVFPVSNNHTHIPGQHHYSLSVPTRCSEIQYCYSECSQFTKQFYQQLKSFLHRINKFFLNKINTLQVMLCCIYKLHLPPVWESPSFVREMLQAFSTINVFSTIFYNKIQS